MKAKNTYTYLLAGFLLCLALKGYAQSTDDFGVWSTVEIEKEIHRKWTLNGEWELRTIDNSSDIGRWSIKAGADYNFKKWLKAGFAYQFLYLNDVEYADFQPRHRLIGFLQGKMKWGNFAFTLRERLQMTTKDESDRIKSSGKVDTYKMNPEWTWRNRIKLAYDIPNCKFTPSLSIESFYQLNNPDGNEFDGLRYILSMDYKLNKKHTINISGLFDKEYNVNDPQSRYVLCLGYLYKF